MFDPLPEGFPGDGDVLARTMRLEVEVAEVMGVLNAAYGRLVDLVGVALDEELWGGVGIHSPAHWLAWQAALAPGRARAIVAIAERRAKLPAAVGALREGLLSVDAAAEIAQKAPGSHEGTITDLAKGLTVSQLRTTLRDYDYGDEATDDPRPGKAKARPSEQERTVSMGTDDRGWWLRGRLPADEGAVVESAIRAARDDLWRQCTEPAGDDDGDAGPAGVDPVTGRRPEVTLADGLLAVAEASLRAGDAAHPGTDRYLVHAHLQARPSTGTGPAGPADPVDPTASGAVNLVLHQGMPLPEALRLLLSCDATCAPVLERDGVPLNVGRRTRVVSRRLRRLIEHRDRGCRIPGCGQRHGLEIHHITHWEHGGPTDTHNLVALCRRHHRAHHEGLVGIAGDADRPPGEAGALEITDRWGRSLPGCGAPTPSTAATPAEAAAHLDLRPGHYQHPYGERLDRNNLYLPPDPPPRRPGRPARPAVDIGPQPVPTG